MTTHLPTDTEIKAACLEFQRTWTPEDEMRHRGLLQSDQIGVDRPGKLATTPPVSTAGLSPELRDFIDAATWWK